VTAKEIAVKKYVVRLSAEERERLETLLHGGKHPAQRLTKARILLKVDAGEAGETWSDSQVAKALDTSLATIARARQQLVEEGFQAVLTRKHSPASARRRRIFDGAAEAKLIALAGSEPPKGRARWTLSLLEDKVVERDIVAKPATTRSGGRKKNTLKPHLKQQFVIPPQASAGFVAAMEDVLEVYHRPHDPDPPGRTAATSTTPRRTGSSPQPMRGLS
jgi:hypothetical protein